MQENPEVQNIQNNESEKIVDKSLDKPSSEMDDLLNSAKTMDDSNQSLSKLQNRRRVDSLLDCLLFLTKYHKRETSAESIMFSLPIHNDVMTRRLSTYNTINVFFVFFHIMH